MHAGMWEWDVEVGTCPLFENQTHQVTGFFFLEISKVTIRGRMLGGFIVAIACVKAY